jgi:hypothetical protein
LIASVAFIIFAGILPSIWRLDSLGALRLRHRPGLRLESFMAPLAFYFDKLLSQIHSFQAAQERHADFGGPTRKKGAEPEEAIFIGIND